MRPIPEEDLVLRVIVQLVDCRVNPMLGDTVASQWAIGRWLPRYTLLFAHIVFLDNRVVEIEYHQ